MKVTVVQPEEDNASRRMRSLARERYFSRECHGPFVLPIVAALTVRAGGAANATEAIASTCSRHADAPPDAADLDDSDTASSSVAYLFFMPLAEHGSLDDVWSKLEDSDAGDSARVLLVKLWSLLDVARGGAATHRSGFVHNDLKPDNVLILANEPNSTLYTSEGAWRAALCDGNLARRLPPHQGHLPGDYGGTPWFQAPEQIVGTHTSRRVDRYAFGAMLFRVLTGRNFGRERDRALSASVDYHWEDNFPHAAYTYEPDAPLLEGWRPFRATSDALVTLTNLLLHPDPCQRPHFDDVIVAMRRAIRDIGRRSSLGTLRPAL